MGKEEIVATTPWELEESKTWDGFRERTHVWRTWFYSIEVKGRIKPDGAFFKKLGGNSHNIHHFSHLSVHFSGF